MEKKRFYTGVGWRKYFIICVLNLGREDFHNPHVKAIRIYSIFFLSFFPFFPSLCCYCGIGNYSFLFCPKWRENDSDIRINVNDRKKGGNFTTEKFSFLFYFFSLSPRLPLPFPSISYLLWCSHCVSLEQFRENTTAGNLSHDKQLSFRFIFIFTSTNISLTVKSNQNRFKWSINRTIRMNA